MWYLLVFKVYFGSSLCFRIWANDNLTPISSNLTPQKTLSVAITDSFVDNGGGVALCAMLHVP